MATSGVNAFTVSNQTGGFFSQPDFPASSALTFQSANMTLNPPGPPPNPLGDIGPNAGTQVLFFPDFVSFDSAEFTATLDKTVFGLGDGSVFTADSSSLDVTLLPSIGTNLTAGTDFALITVSGTISAPAVPEPATWSLLLVAVAWLGTQAWRKHKSEVVPVKSD